MIIELRTVGASPLIRNSCLEQLVYLHRARPVVNLEAEVAFVTDAGKIDITSKDCVISSGERVACVPIKMCLRYSGVGVEKKMGRS